MPPEFVAQVRNQPWGRRAKTRNSPIEAILNLPESGAPCQASGTSEGDILRDITCFNLNVYDESSRPEWDPSRGRAPVSKWAIRSVGPWHGSDHQPGARPEGSLASQRAIRYKPCSKFSVDMNFWPP
jgi:hypothetical protein